MNISDLDYRESVHTAVAHWFLETICEFRQDSRDYGFGPAFLLRIVNPEAGRVVTRINRRILDRSDRQYKRKAPDQDRESWSLKMSYSTSFSMIAVAGAIVAQIAITALSLPHLKQTHWTVEAAFVASLLFGLLSVYYACVDQLEIGSLHSPEDLKQWLISYPSREEWEQDKDLARANPKGPKQIHMKLTPSYGAALLLTIPSRLLDWSLFSLLIGIGIYYGLVFTEHLGSLRGGNSNLALLVVYIVVTLVAVGTHTVPSLIKFGENHDHKPTRYTSEEFNLRRWGRFPWFKPRQDPEAQRPAVHNTKVKEGQEVAAVPASRSRVPPTHTVKDALQASVSAQRANLQALEALLHAYSRET